MTAQEHVDAFFDTFPRVEHIEAETAEQIQERFLMCAGHCAALRQAGFTSRHIGTIAAAQTLEIELRAATSGYAQLIASTRPTIARAR